MRYEVELSYSLSNVHCFFIVMSEEVVGLVRLHCFSPINSKVKYCKGTEKDSQRKAKGSEKDYCGCSVEAVTFISTEPPKPVLLRSIHMTTQANSHKDSHSKAGVDIKITAENLVLKATLCV